MGLGKNTCLNARIRAWSSKRGFLPHRLRRESINHFLRLVKVLVEPLFALNHGLYQRCGNGSLYLPIHHLLHNQLTYLVINLLVRLQVPGQYLPDLLEVKVFFQLLRVFKVKRCQWNLALAFLAQNLTQFAFRLFLDGLSSLGLRQFLSGNIHVLLFPRRILFQLWFFPILISFPFLGNGFILVLRNLRTLLFLLWFWNGSYSLLRLFRFRLGNLSMLFQIRQLEI